MKTSKLLQIVALGLGMLAAPAAKATSACVLPSGCAGGHWARPDYGGGRVSPYPWYGYAYGSFVGAPFGNAPFENGPRHHGGSAGQHIVINNVVGYEADAPPAHVIEPLIITIAKTPAK